MTKKSFSAHMSEIHHLIKAQNYTQALKQLEDGVEYLQNLNHIDSDTLERASKNCTQILEISNEFQSIFRERSRDKRTLKSARVANGRFYVRVLACEMHMNLKKQWLTDAIASKSVDGFNPQDTIATFTLILRQFRKDLQQRFVPHTVAVATFSSATIYELLAQYGPGGAATSNFKQWNIVSTEIGRSIRFEYEVAKTLGLKYAMRDQGNAVAIGKRSLAGWKWIRRRVYALTSGYGLKSVRFGTSIASVVMLFALAYYGSDQVSCSASSNPIQGIWHGVITSISAFTTIGPVDEGCSPIFSTLRAGQSLVGYFMLGILISLLWQNFAPETWVSSSNTAEHNHETISHEI